MQHINPKYFRAFKAVVQAGSFSEASEIAAMTQANVSKHIKSLEEQIGSELFVRTPTRPSHHGSRRKDGNNTLNKWKISTPTSWLTLMPIPT